MPNQDYDYLFKYIIVGDSAVGKSSIRLRFTDNKFPAKHDETIGVDFGEKMMNRDGKKIKLQLWDTGEQTYLESIIQSCYRGAVAAILVYDVTRRDTFKCLTTWLEELKEHDNNDMSIILIANKTDLENARVVSTEEGKNFAEAYGILYIETSAKNDRDKDPSVENAFASITEAVCPKYMADGSTDVKNKSNGIKLASSTTQEPNNAASSSLLQQYRKHGGSNLSALAFLATHSSREACIDMLKQRAEYYVLTQRTASSASYQTLKEALLAKELESYEASINKKRDKLLKPVDSKQSQAEVYVAYRENGGKNWLACSSLFFNQYHKDKQIDILTERAFAALKRGALDSASIKTLQQVKPKALEDLLGSKVVTHNSKTPS